MQNAIMRDGAGTATRPRVIIVGAGFGGLAAARRLADQPVDVLLIDRTNYHLFTPLLYQVATAGLEPEEIAHPVRGILRGAENISFRVMSATGVDPAGKLLLTEAGNLPYDFLILAAGSTTNFFGLQAPEAMGLKDIPEALALRNHILSRFELAAWEQDPDRRRALLTFVVVGGGPTGVEMAGAITELVRHVLPRDFPSIDFRQTRIMLLEAVDTLLAPFRPSLQRKALKRLRGKGVDVRFGARVAKVEDDRITLGDETVIEAGTLIWAAGVRASELAGAVPSAHGPSGRLQVDACLRLPDYPNVYVIGDLAAFQQDGHALPMLAPVAMREGEHAAESILRAARGQQPRPFRYKSRGIMATIGRNAAVAQIGPLSLDGFVAWFVWLWLHLVQIIGFRNRLVVLVNWLWDYLFYERAVRLITSPFSSAGASTPLVVSPATVPDRRNGDGVAPARDGVVVSYRAAGD